MSFALCKTKPSSDNFNTISLLPLPYNNNSLSNNEVSNWRYSSCTLQLELMIFFS